MDDGNCDVETATVAIHAEKACSVVVVVVVPRDDGYGTGECLGMVLVAWQQLNTDGRIGQGTRDKIHTADDHNNMDGVVNRAEVLNRMDGVREGEAANKAEEEDREWVVDIRVDGCREVH